MLFSALPSYISASAGASYTYSSSTGVLSLSSGTLTFTADADPTSSQEVSLVNLSASGTGSKVLFDSNEHIAGLSLTDGATATVTSVTALGGTWSNDNHDVLVIGTEDEATAPTFEIDSESKLDLADNDMIVHGGNDSSSDFAAVQAASAVGRNVAPGGIYDGTWDGNGLTSSTAAVVDSGENAGYEETRLAVVLNSDLFLGQFSDWSAGSFNEPLRSDGNDVIVKYTYNGDLTLDGAVDGNADTVFGAFYYPGVSLVDQGLNNDYAFGDLNGDGFVDGNDDTIFGAVYGNGMSPDNLAAIGLTATPGSSTGSVAVASFTDTSSDAATANFATIDWGDGSSATDGTIVSNGSGNWLVKGSHTYSAVGSYPVVISIDSSVAATTATVVPSAPTGLSATASGSTEINLAWTASTGAASYTIERSTDGTDFTAIGTAGSTATTYSDTSLSPGTDYTYEVVATNSSESSAASASAAAFTQPSSLSALTATAASSSGVSLSWTDVAGATGYKIDRNDSSGDWEQIGTVDAPAASYGDTSLTDGTAYTYQVIPYNDSGDADGTNPSASATTSLLAPDNVAAVALSSTSIEIVWDDQSAAETGFEVQRSTDGTTFSNLGSIAAGTTNYTDTTAAADTEYWYRVESTNSAAGSSTPSAATDATTPATESDAGPATPTLSATVVSSSEIDLTTSVPTDGSNLELEEQGPNDDNFAVVDITPTSSDDTLTYAVTGLTNHTLYSFRLRADLNGQVAYASAAAQTASDPDAPPTPTIVSVTPDSNPDNPGVLDVVASGDYAAGTEIVAYAVQNSDHYQTFADVTMTWADEDAPSSDGVYHFELPNGLADTPYTLYVEARSGPHFSGYAEQQVEFGSSTPLLPAGCQPEISVTPMDDGEGDYQVNWTGALTSAQLTEYGADLTSLSIDYQDLYFIPASGPNHGHVELVDNGLESASDGSGSAVEELGPGQVFMTSGVGVSNVVTIDGDGSVAAPATPGNLSAMPYSDGTSAGIRLLWDNDSNNETGFTIQRSTSADFSTDLQTFTVAADVTSYVDNTGTDDTSVQPGTTYYYQVEATNSAGSSSFSSSAYASVTLPTVSVTAVDPDAQADPQDAWFEVSRTGNVSQASTVDLGFTGTEPTTDYTVTDGSDTVSSSVQFVAGQQSLMLQVQPTADPTEPSGSTSALPTLTVISTLADAATYTIGVAAATDTVAPPSANFTVISANVTFDSNTILKDDGSGAYPTTNQWVDKDGRDNPADPKTTSLPLSYNAGDSITASVDFGIAGQDPSGNYTITGVASGIGTEGMTFTWHGTLGGGQTHLQATITSGVPLNDLIDYGTLDIDWTVTHDGNSVHYGSTSNRIYVTAGGRNAQFETVLLVGCQGGKEANPISATEDIIAGIWSEFASRMIDDAEGNLLHYWGVATATPWTTTEALLKRHDGTCSAWTAFFRDVLAAQGIAATVYKIVPEIPADDPNGGLSVPDMKESSLVVYKALPGQGGDPSRNIFTDHKVVMVGSTIYDPSYGDGPYASKLAWEDASVVEYEYAYVGDPLPTFQADTKGKLETNWSSE
jgi:hypothetical protein